ncbi:MAG: hypothetical protein ABI553_08835 [Chloroflexota bacterium]
MVKRVTRIQKVAIVALLLVSAFLFGATLGASQASCYAAARYEQAARDDFERNGIDYWGTSVRTLVEACEKGTNL